MSASLIVAATKEDLAPQLARSIVRCAAAAIQERGAFTVALSGGSLPALLTSLLVLAVDHGNNNPDHATRVDDPRFDKWHVILSDERMVPLDHPDSNLGELNKVVLSQLPIPPSQIYGPRLPDAVASASSTDEDSAIAAEYEATVRSALSSTGGALDLAVLGFGPDGHTCSLFPNHPLLLLRDTDGGGGPAAPWVAAIGDSPKPPPRRITLTLPMLNRSTRNVIFCGAGASKDPILRHVFASVKEEEEEEAVAPSSGSRWFKGILSDPPPYPCAMVRPGFAADSSSQRTSLTWIVDADAAHGIVPVPST